MEEPIDHVVDLIVKSNKIVVFTGAGISTESGIPDFRSPGGVWSKYNPDDFTFQRFVSSETAREMRDRVGLELFQHFRDGPFFAGRTEPSLLDFAIFPQLVFGYMVGYEEELAIAQVPSLREWLARMSQYLPENPLLVPDFMIIHSLKQAVGEEFAA